MRRKKAFYDGVVYFSAQLKTYSPILADIPLWHVKGINIIFVKMHALWRTFTSHVNVITLNKFTIRLKPLLLVNKMAHKMVNTNI